MKITSRILAAVLVLVMLLAALPVFAAEDQVYVFDATADLQPMEQGAKAVGDTQKVGTDDFFTIYFSEKVKIDSSNKKWEDGYEASQRLNFSSKTKVSDSEIKNCVGITTTGPATVKIWWVEAGEDSRQIGIYNAAGEIVTQTNVEGLAKNDPCLSTLEIPEAGTYYIGNVINHNYFFKIEVTVHATEIPDPSTPSTGDPVALFVALMAVSALGITILDKKKF